MNALRLTLAFIILTVPLRTGQIQSGLSSCPASGAAQVGAGLSTINAYQVFLQAPVANTGTVVVGGPNVTASPANGIQIPGNNVLDVMIISKPNAGVTLQSIWFACTASGDKLIWVASQ